jgi:hypothetical protein
MAQVLADLPTADGSLGQETIAYDATVGPDVSLTGGAGKAGGVGGALGKNGNNVVEVHAAAEISWALVHHESPSAAKGSKGAFPVREPSRARPRVLLDSPAGGA